MIRRILLALAVLAAAFMAGCASGPRYSEVASQIQPIPANQGRIYFFRSNSMMGAALQPDVRLNGDVVGTSKPGGFFYVDRPAGSYTAATSNDKSTSFTLDAGQTRYLRSSVSFGVLVGGVSLELEEAQKAMAEIQTLSFTGTATARSTAVPKPVDPVAPPSAELVQAPAVDATGRPARTRHLDAAMLEGQTWTFPHPRDPARFGDVRIRFKGGIANANNARGGSAGPFSVVGDMVCIDFESRDWSRACYYAYDADGASGAASRPMLWSVSTRVGVPLTIN